MTQAHLYMTRPKAKLVVWVAALSAHLQARLEL